MEKKFQENGSLRHSLQFFVSVHLTIYDICEFNFSCLIKDELHWLGKYKIYLSYNYLFHQDGFYYLSTMDSYIVLIAVLTLVIFKMAALVYVYKAKNIEKHLLKMNTTKLSFVSYWLYILVPILLVCFHCE